MRNVGAYTLGETPKKDYLMPKQGEAHKELVKRAVLWLLGSGGCDIAFSEFHTCSSEESADAIGFSGAISILIECKASRMDFRSDRKKTTRIVPEIGMGQRRYYMVPGDSGKSQSIIKPGEMPDKWGLLLVYDRHVTVAHSASGGFARRNYRAEIAFLASMLRRAEIRAKNAHLRSGAMELPVDFLNQWLRWEMADGATLNLVPEKTAKRHAV